MSLSGPWGAMDCGEREQSPHTDLVIPPMLERGTCKPFRTAFSHECYCTDKLSLWNLTALIKEKDFDLANGVKSLTLPPR
jgi:hypothetical protein